MKKKCLLLGYIITTILSGCGTILTESNVMYEDTPLEDNEEKLLNLSEMFLDIGEIDGCCNYNMNLIYDTTTGIVYIEGRNFFTTYYAPNGLPYKYNPETNTLEEIR